MTREEVQQAALEAIGNKRKAGLEISMGVGKTRIALEYIRIHYTEEYKALVVIPKNDIVNSWKEEMTKMNCEYLMNTITFVNYKSLPKKDFDYDLVVFDECHSLKKTHNDWTRDFYKTGGNILGLTGTYPPNNKNSEKSIMCNFYCPKVFVYNTTNAVDDKILNDYKIIVHQLQLSNELTIEKEGRNGSFKISEKSEYDYWTKRLDNAPNDSEKQRISIQRMKLLQGYLTKVIYAKKLLEEQKDKTIVFANTKEQADTLCQFTFHSDNDLSKRNLNLFNDGKIKRLAAVNQLSEGVNIKNLKVGIILHTYSNNRQASQRIGRLLRLNPKEKATIHILCYNDTVDKYWVEQALKDFDQKKIEWR